MKITTWNCNGAFRKKIPFIETFNSHIYVIQECENPECSNNKLYKSFAKNYIWIGHGSKGLGIFAKDNIKLHNNNWKSFGLNYFLSCKINNDILLLAIWGHGNYIEDIYVYFQIYFNAIKSFKKVIICGDFNSNSIWDKKHKKRTHSAVVKQLENINIKSSYHNIYKEPQGKESTPTFYMYRKKERPYHIDYFFLIYSLSILYILVILMNTLN